MSRKLSTVDHLLVRADRVLRAMSGVRAGAAAASPGAAVPATELDERARLHAARLMRVNHSGEVAAQALYDGQAATARGEQVRAVLLEAAREESAHLAWCEQRVRELGDRTSRLAPLWYAGSYAIGALAGLAGDRVSLGFVAETERQVVDHLDEHLAQLPPDDARSRAILEQMRADEARHGDTAQQAGGASLPAPVRQLMRATARIMTKTAYWL